MGSKMAWTIIRPGGLKNEAGTGNGVLSEDKSICGAISREDVADLVVKALFSSKADNKASAHLRPFVLCCNELASSSGNPYD